MKSKSLFIFVYLISIGLLAQPKKIQRTLQPKQASEVSQLPVQKEERVDPHGSATLAPTIKMAQDTKECSVCHDFQSGHLATKPAASESCRNCHNEGPHSGVAEHALHKITCASCHGFHRADSQNGEARTGYFSILVKPNERRHPHAMIKKTCTDCHRW